MKIIPIPILTVLLMASLSQLDADTIPYTNNFNGTGGNTAFTNQSLVTDWSVGSGVYQYRKNNTNQTASTATIAITNAAATTLTLQTQFTVSTLGTINNGAQTLGFGLFGSSSTFSTSSGNSYYLADFSYADSSNSQTGLLRILSLGDSANFSTTSTGLADDNSGSGSLAVVLGTTYTLRLDASYVGSTLNMTLGLYDAAGTTQIGSSATVSDTTPLAGTFFGFRNRDSRGGGSLAVDFDNYSMVASAIPEPSTCALIGGLGVLGLAMLRRRRA